MADRETTVRYKALGDFMRLNRNLRQARKNVDDLKKSVDESNAASAKANTAQARGTRDSTKAQDEYRKSVDKTKTTVKDSTVKFIENAKAIRETEKSATGAGRATEALGKAHDAAGFATRRARIEAERHAAGLGKAEVATRRQRREIERMQQTMGRARGGVNQFYQGLQKLQNWRPKLTPPFIVLIPAIAGVIGLINPLVAGLGAVGAAGLGMASSLGSAASVLVTGLAPAIATAIGLVASLKTALGGVGGAFKAFGALKKGGGGGGGGGGSRKQEITDAEKLARAQQDLADATQDVLFAQEDLDDARKDYIKRLNDLRRAVDRAALSEARAAANSQLARENYANVLADPGSTRGQKMDASASVGEAQNDYSDVIRENRENLADYQEMQAKGIEQDRDVIMAQRALTDAINRQRDAQIALANEASGANKALAGGGGAADEYAKALAKLSPSARRFVETVVGMQDRWEALQRTVQEAFFSEVDGSKIAKYFEPVEHMLSVIAGAAGRVFDKFLDLTTSDQWLKDIALFGDLAAPIVETVGDGLLSLLDAFKDLTIAAMPFLQALADGFKEGAANFAAFIKNGRETGSIAKWLEDGRRRLAQWWRIIKNIGQTLYNYGKAAAPFADWLTNGLEKITEGWKANSEEAAEAGSPFQKYLEDIKPLLSELSGLLGDFFGWFSKEAMDPKNIQEFTDVLKTLREDIGPALEKAFDALSDAEIGPKLVDGVGKLIEFVSTVLDNGGAATLGTFFDILGGLLDALTTFAASPGGGTILTILGTTLAALAALSFVGQFTGLTSLLGVLLKFSKGGGPGILKNLGTTLGGLGKGGGALTLGAKALPLAGAAGGPATRAEAKAMAAAAKAGAGGGLLSKIPGLGAITKNPLLKAGSKVLGPIGALLGIIEQVDIATNTSDISQFGAKKGDTKAQATAKRKGLEGQVLGKAGEGALGGALTGATIGTMIFPGVGTAIGAAVGGVGGGINGAISGGGGWDTVQKGIDVAGKDPEKFKQAQNQVSTDIFGEDMGGWLNEVRDGIFEFFAGIPQAIEDGWNNLVVTPFNEAKTNIETWWNDTVVTPFSEAKTNIENWWNENVVRPFQATQAAIGRAWDMYVAQPFNRVSTLVQTAWQTYVAAPFQRVSSIVQAAWQTYVAQPFQRVSAMVQSAWQTYVATPFNNIVTTIKDAWQNYVVTPFTNVINGIKKAWDDFWAGFKNFNLADAITNFMNGVARNGGGIIRRAGGGSVPGEGTTDKVPAMLTPGEVVLKNSVVRAMGPENADRFGRGLITFGEAYQTAMRSQPSGSKKDKTGGPGMGMSFFAGGGLVSGPTFPPGGFGGGPDAPSFPGGGQGGTQKKFTIENLNVINPTAEPTSQSLPRSIRKAAFAMGDDS